MNRVLDNHMYEYDLCWLVEKIKKIMETQKTFDEALLEIQRELEQTNGDVSEILQFITDLKNGVFPEEFVNALRILISTDLVPIISEAIKMVFFGLTDTGYFCAYIPKNWSDITFDTGSVYGRFDYGRLILKYVSDGSGVIDNTGGGDSNAIADLWKAIYALSVNSRKVNKTLYTAMDKGGT